MPCFHPVTAYRSRLGHAPNGAWPIVFNVKDGYADKIVIVPCGKCIGCRMEKARNWAMRCVHEASLYDQNCFITLTYNDDSLLSPSLNKRDIILFLKKLRKKIGKFRYYQCGEYGEKFNRPHHHACIFGNDFPDKVLIEETAAGPLYTSKIAEECWGHGWVSIGEVTQDSASYVAKYVIKKINGERAEGHYKGLQPEYSTMSRRPGIGREWWEKWQKDVLCSDAVIMRGGLTARPPKYYDSLYKKHHPSEMEVIKRKRQKERRDLTPEQLAVKEKIAKLRFKTFKRRLENGQPNFRYQRQKSGRL